MDKPFLRLVRPGEYACDKCGKLRTGCGPHEPRKETILGITMVFDCKGDCIEVCSESGRESDGNSGNVP